MVKLPKDFNCKDYSILIVDDDEAFLKAFVDDFSGDFTVHQAENAKTGMKIVNRRQDIAVVLADQRMPEMTGVQLLMQLKTQHPNITRILITGYADIEAAIDAINIGDIFKYISKPYKFEEVKEVIMRGIEKYHRVKQAKAKRQQEMETLRKTITAESRSALNMLTFGLTHHINNKLTSVYTFLQLLPEKIKSLVEKLEDDKEYWEVFHKKVEADVETIKGLLVDLLMASTDENELVKADIIKLMLSKKEIFETLSKGKQIKFQHELPKDSVFLELDPLKIGQALENIVLNSIQAIADKGIIKIKAEQIQAPEKRIKIAITDNGQGISQDNLKNIFSPFFTTKGPQVKGLGLTIADLIVRQHGGGIKISSKPNEGTSVSIELPLFSDAG